VHHLAQVNVARLLAPLDGPQLEPFVSALEPVNAIADAAPGFVWRLQTEEGDATSVRAFPDPDILVNMSVWTSVEALRAFVSHPDHVAVLRQRRQFFEVPSDAYTTLWWVNAGHIPTVDEAKERLEFLRSHGPSPWAFTFAHPEPPLTVTRVGLDDGDAQQLISELNADIMATHAEGSHFWGLTAEDVSPGHGAFLVLHLHGEPVGCGAVRTIEPGVAELKRMFVKPVARNKKLGAVLVDNLEREARAVGATRLLLETALYLESAVRVYERAGFTPTEAWGEYVGSTDSYCMAKALG
jgi:GNAT superfamily N-acetyltransferase